MKCGFLDAKLGFIASISQSHIQAMQPAVEPILYHAIEQLHANGIFAELLDVGADEDGTEFVLVCRTEQDGYRIPVEVTDIGYRLAGGQTGDGEVAIEFLVYVVI